MLNICRQFISIIFTENADKVTSVRTLSLIFITSVFYDNIKILTAKELNNTANNCKRLFLGFELLVVHDSRQSLQLIRTFEV